MESKKESKLVNITKRKQTHRYREQTSVISGGGKIGVGDSEVQTLMHKVNKL